MAPEENPNFSTTNWSVVLAAARSNPEAAGLALERLCRRNWFPVYAFIRQRGHGPHDAEDLAQGFFQFVIERHALQRLDRSKGRFRSFLLAALTNKNAAAVKASSRWMTSLARPPTRLKQVRLARPRFCSSAAGP
jgi:DNA-directed RNA polymerase specialized sigma24 family protein